jgi:transposase InsO family protein
MLTVTDECTRQSLAVFVGLSVTAQTVASVLEQVIAKHGAPVYLRSDNGPEFVALALRGFLFRSGIQTAYIDKGSPWQNGFAESFHSRFRDEFLNGEVFLSVKDAQVRVEQWRNWYNTERPHSSLGYQTPNEFSDAWSTKEESKAARTNTPIGT